MFGGGSIQLARVFGVRIGVDVSWFFVLFLIIWSLSGYYGGETKGFVLAVVSALLFFGSIVLHELGHALAARREGISVAGIDLFFFGGLMRMNRDTDSPGGEFRVAVAGPLVTAVIVVVGTLLGIALTGSSRGFVLAATLDADTGASVFELLIAFVVSMNLLLLVLNLVPAFPLDGGRIARSVAWKITGDRVRATRISAVLGQGFAWVLIGFGILLAVQGALVNGLWLVVLGWLLGQAARTAVAQTSLSERLRGISVAEVMDSEPVAIPVGTPALQAWETFFLRYQGWKWFPVVDAEQRPVGIAHRAAIEHAAHEEDGRTPVQEVAVQAEPEDLVEQTEPLEVLVGAPELRARGGLLAIDADGRLRGVVTLRRVSRALSAQLAPR